MNKKVIAIALSGLFVAASAQAALPGYWKDSSGNFVKDSNGDCVKTGNWNAEDHGNQGCDAGSDSSTAADKAAKKAAADAAARKKAAEEAARKRADEAGKQAAEDAAKQTAEEKAAAAKVVEEKKKTLEQLRNISLSSGAAFESGSTTLSSEGKKSLDELAVKLKLLGDGIKSVQVDGHTDSTGSDAVNQRVSEKRAAAVKDYLVSKGVDGGKINTKGYGESQPVADNNTASGRAENRRVEIKVSGDVVETVTQ